MKQTDLPPLPPRGTPGPAVCLIYRRYLAVYSDLSPEQQEIIATHVRACPQCAREQQLLQQVHQRITDLEETEPSPQVDEAIRSALSARRSTPRSSSLQYTTRAQSNTRQRRFSGLPVMIPTIAAALILVLLTTLVGMHIISFPWNGNQAFHLPDNLTWNNYVLYHKQTLMGSEGKPYQVETYHDLSSNMMNVETKMDGSYDVVVVTDMEKHKELGMDMMHHVAQWSPFNEHSDDALFDLAKLRADLKSGRAVYQGKDTFKGQPVYRVRYPDNSVLLLDMHYMPVNVLKDANQPGTGTPVYDQLQWLSPNQVPSDMWDMNVPPGFSMGTLPSKP